MLYLCWTSTQPPLASKFMVVEGATKVIKSEGFNHLKWLDFFAHGRKERNNLCNSKKILMIYLLIMVILIEIGDYKQIHCISYDLD